MKKEFDINPGDSVWVMHDNIAVLGTVGKTWYKKFINPSDFETVEEAEIYSIYSGTNKIGEYSPNEVFKTKEDLLKSL